MSAIKTDIKTFDSAAELISATVSHAHTQSSFSDSKWIGRKFDSRATLEREANSAWGKGMELLAETRERMGDVALPQPTTRRRRVHFSEFDGDEFDFDRFRAGQTYWRTTRRENRTGLSTIAIAVDVCAVWTKTAIDLAWRGLATTILVELLEHAGYRVEIFAYAAVNPRRYRKNDIGSFWVTNLKRPSDPLDSATLVSVTSGWFFRTFGIAGLYLNRFHSESDGCGPVIQKTAAELENVIGQPITVNINNVWNITSAVREITATIEAIEKTR